MVTEPEQKVVVSALATGELLTKFWEDCRARGLSPSTITGYNTYLKHFAAENPELPTDPEIIEKWLLARGESFQKRGDALKRLQSFYDYLWRIEAVSASPIPPGKIGRPRKPVQPKKPRGRPRKLPPAMAYTIAGENTDKVVEGGGRYQLTFTGTITLTPL